MTLEGGASPASAASDAQAPGVPWGPAAALVGFLVAIAAITMTTTVVVVLDPGQHSTVGRETGALLAYGLNTVGVGAYVLSGDN